MFDTIDTKIKRLKLLTKRGGNTQNIVKLKLDIFSMLLGYYSAQYDKDYFHIYDNKDRILELEKNIQDVLNIDIKIINFDGNILGNFKKIIFASGNEQDKYHNVFRPFIVGYNYYTKSLNDKQNKIKKKLYKTEKYVKSV